MPDPGDGFAVVTAMRHCQPDVLNLVCSDFPDVQRSMAAIALQADKVLVKPFDARQLAALLDRRKQTPTTSLRPAKESVAAILDRDLPITIQRWLSRVEEVPELNALALAAKDRTEYLPAIMESITARLRSARAFGAPECANPIAAAHGRLRFRQGYTAPLIVYESRILQVCIFETIERNLSTVDFTKVLPDIMTIADEVDCQLKQAIESFLTIERGEPNRAHAAVVQ